MENQIPAGVRRLSLQHARFLFFMVVNDHDMKSSRLYAKAKALFRQRPDLFVPAEVVSRYGGRGLDRLRRDILGPEPHIGIRYSTPVPSNVSDISWTLIADVELDRCRPLRRGDRERSH